MQHPTKCRVLSRDKRLDHSMVHSDMTLLKKALDIEPLLEIALGDVEDA